MEQQKKSLEDILRETNENDTTKEIPRIVSLASVFVSAYTLVYLIVSLCAKDIWLAVRSALILAVPFLLVSLVRYLVKAPRPTELFDFYGEQQAKKKPSRAFPSRHAFSAFAIGTLMLFFHWVLALVTLGLGILMSIARVLLGHHFPRDVIAGALIGIASSVIGYLIFIL